MKYYGRPFPEKSTYLSIRNYKRKINLRARTAALSFVPNSRYKTFQVSIYIPSLWKFVMFKNSTYLNYLILSMRSSVYYAHIVILNWELSFLIDSKTRSLNLKFKFFNNYFNLYWFTFFLVFNSISQIFFNKLKFRGKGYYVYKNFRNVIAFQFGFSHRVKIYLFFLNVKFLSKTSVLLFGVNKFDILKGSNLFLNKRPVNVFTGRGVRFTRQTVYRKTGKISTYR